MPSDDGVARWKSILQWMDMEDADMSFLPFISDTTVDFQRKREEAR